MRSWCRSTPPSLPRSPARPTCAAANITITPLHSSIFYADFSPSPPSLPDLAGHYVGYQITNNTGAALASPYLKLSNFTGGVVSLATGQGSAQPLGALSTSASGKGYFYLAASAATAAAQTHTVAVYDRNPTLSGATELCNTTFSFTSVTGTTQAAANKVTVATATSNPPGLGAVMTMTVQGDTGTIGGGPAADPKGWDMTPAAVASGASAWTPGAFRLTGVNLNIDLDGTGAKNWSDYLHRTFTDASSSARTYTITYTFVIVGTTSANTGVTPIQYIASGTQIKHTDMSSSTYNSIAPISPIANTTTLAKSANPTTLTTPGGTVTYTVTATNSSGTQSATLDDFTDTPGTGGTYVAGSSKYNGSTIADPVASGTSLVWQGAFLVPASSSRTLTYDVAITSGIATVTNSVVGHVGASQIDTTTSTSDNSPPTANVAVAAAPKIDLQKSVSNRLDSTDQFTVATKNGASTVASATTAGAAVSAATGSTTVTSGTTYTLADTMAAGSASTLAQYAASIACTNSKVGSTTVLPSGSGTSFTLTPQAGDVITCTFTNGSRPQLTLLKSVAGRINAGDQFAGRDPQRRLECRHRVHHRERCRCDYRCPDAHRRHELHADRRDGRGLGVGDRQLRQQHQLHQRDRGLDHDAAVGQRHLQEHHPGKRRCHHLHVHQHPARTDADVRQVDRESRLGHRSVHRQRHARRDHRCRATTSGAGASASTGATTLAPGTTYTLGEVMTGGSASALSDYAGSIACTNAASGSSTTLPSGTGQSFTIIPAAGDAISCTLTNTAMPRVNLAKTIASRVVAGDQFTVSITHGATTDASAATSGAGTTAATGAQGLVAGTTYTLSESVTGGSSTLTDYIGSISCIEQRVRIGHGPSERERHLVHGHTGSGRQHLLHHHQHREAAPHPREVGGIARERR